MSNSAPDLPPWLDASRDKPDKGLHKARNEPVLCTVYSIKPPSFSTIRYSTRGRNKIMSRSNQVRHWDIPVHMKRRNPVGLDNLRRIRQVLGPRVSVSRLPSWLQPRCIADGGEEVPVLEVLSVQVRGFGIAQRGQSRQSRHI